MLRQRKWRVILIVALALGVIFAAIFQRQIRIAYHKNQLYTAARYFQFAGPNLVSPPRPTRIEMIMLTLGRGKYPAETDRMRLHTEALKNLGYFVKQEFPLHNRLYESGSNHLAFNQLLIDRFDFTKSAALTNDWWELTGTESNRIVVTTTTNLLPRWRQLVEDFDRP